MWKQLSAFFVLTLTLLMIAGTVSSVRSDGDGVQVVEAELVTKPQIEAALDMAFAVLEALVAQTQVHQAEIEALKRQCAKGGAQ